MFRTVSLHHRNEPGRPYHGKTAATPVVTFRFSAALFQESLNSAIKAASVPPRNDFGLSPFAGRGAARVSANSRGGRL